MAMAMVATTTANTAVTMSTSTGNRGGLRWGVAAAALLVGGLLVVSAIPRIAAHSAVLPGSAVSRAMDEGRSVSSPEAEAAYRAYTDALAWLPNDPALRAERARLARRLSLLDAQPEWASRAVDDFRAAAALSPGDGVIWARLAEAELAAGAEVETVLPHLRLARLTAPRRASALFPQFVIVMRHWEAMPDDMRAHALADLPIFWGSPSFRPVLLRSYLDAGFAARAAFRDRLAENPRALQGFDRLLSATLGL